MKTQRSRLLAALLGGSLAVVTIAAACSSDTTTEVTPQPKLPTFTATLNGANEKPNAVNTAATGTAEVVINGTTGTYTVTVNNLTGPPRLSHIHAPGDVTTTASVIVNFNATSVTGTSGTFSGTFTAADIVGQGGNPAITLDSLVTLMKNGRAYVNVHTAQFGAGEIRGQLVQQP